MPTETERHNKAIVLEAFDTLFNQRDYVAAERFWSPNYVQHSAHMGLLQAWGRGAPRRERTGNSATCAPVVSEHDETGQNLAQLCQGIGRVLRFGTKKWRFRSAMLVGSIQVGPVGRRA